MILIVSKIHFEIYIHTSTVIVVVVVVDQMILPLLNLPWTKHITVDINESKTLTANAVPQANGCVRYNSVSGSSSSSWSRNCTLLSLTSSLSNNQNMFMNNLHFKKHQFESWMSIFLLQGKMDIALRTNYITNSRDISSGSSSNSSGKGLVTVWSYININAKIYCLIPEIMFRYIV